MRTKWKSLILVLVILLSIGVMTACKKEDPKPAEEKVFSLEKTETETPPATETKQELHYVLYLKVDNTPYLMDDLQVVPDSEFEEANANLPLFSLNKLFAFSAVRGLSNPIPAGTKLIKFELVDGLAKVNLSKEFVPTEMPKEDAKLAIAAIVNTLTYFNQIDTVNIYIEGEKLNNYFGLDVSEEMVFFDNLYPEK